MIATIMLGSPGVPSFDITNYHDKPTYKFAIPSVLLMPYDVDFETTKLRYLAA